ncbi:hypothetical protein GJ496_001771 [Pomphorhynchus laevis]|nr:hypothetical protein GJ496_001771 [Pomphorhynchus laevis]
MIHANRYVMIHANRYVMILEPAEQDVDTNNASRNFDRPDNLDNQLEAFTELRLSARVGRIPVRYDQLLEERERRDVIIATKHLMRQ